MAHTFPRYCPRCGTPTRENMRLCTTCGLPVATMLDQSRNQQSTTQATTPEPARVVSTSQPMEHQTQQSPMPPMPAYPIPPTPRHAPDQPDTLAEQATALSAPMQPSPSQAPMEPPKRPLMPQQATWATQIEPLSVRMSVPQAQSKRRVAILLVLLAVLLMLGVGGYLAFAGLRMRQAPIKNINLHMPFTYAGMNITLLNTQQAPNFVDDPQTANNGMVRLHLQEQNTTTTQITWNYAQSARLLVQGQAAIAPVYVQSKGKIAPGATQSSVLDFAVPNSGNLSKMSLQLGSAHEAQVRIPLAGQANLSKYQPQSRSQHGSMVYFGLNWTLTSSTTSLSIPNQQAPNSMEYLTLAMTINNTLTQQAITGSPFNYARIKIGGKTFNPISTTLPVSFASGVMGKVGMVTFLIPQNSTSCTFLLLSQDPGGSGQASTDFLLGHAIKP